MKTPEEIKKGLECCSTSACKCFDCPYEGECHLPFGSDPESDALAYIQQLEDHIRDLTKMIPKWISVKERLPDLFEVVLIIDDRKVVFPAHLAEKGGLKGFYSVDGYFYTYITHWMPLPKPPKEAIE